MGTKIDCESYLPGVNSMRNPNVESSTSGWPILFGDKMPRPNGQYYNGFMQMNGFPGHDKDALKQKMLEHEAVFKNQVFELHRLYRIQRDMMEEVKRKDTDKYRASVEPASSSFQGSQVPLDEARKWHMTGFPLLNPSCSRTSIFGVEIVNFPTSNVKMNAAQPIQLPFRNGDTEDTRPMKLRKKLFDLQTPADDYIDIQEGENSRNHESSMKLFFGGRGSKGSVGLADLNEPVQVEETVGRSSIDFLGRAGNVHDGFTVNSSNESKVNTRGGLSHTCNAGSSKGNLSFASQAPQPDKLHLPSHPMQGMFNQAYHTPGTYSSGYYNREHMWRGESQNRNRDQTSSYRSDPPIASQTHGLYPFVSSSSFAASWAHSVSSLAKTMNGSAQNLAALNGFSHPLALGSKKLQTSDCSTNHGFGIFPYHAVSKPAIDINLNQVLSNEVLIPQDHKGEGNPKDPLSALPWLKHKKNPGLPTSVSFEEKNVIKGTDNGLIDINVACEPNDQIATEEVGLDSVKDPLFRDHHAFDLNSCFGGCEDSPPPPLKITLEIDLEVPIFLEDEDDDNTTTLSKQNAHDEAQLQNEEKQINDVEVLTDAAKTILAISSSSQPIDVDEEEASLAEALLRFRVCPSKMDDFEATTLNLTETKEEDYMPKPFVFEIKDESGAHGLQTRSRRGQTRRGRQRKDFQRDILPGLTTLSRNEVTEDLQTFGGMMRAMGHSWKSNLTGRNGGGRGKKRVDSSNVPSIGSSVCGPLLKQLNNQIQMEDRSLTGWGKTTRRPRRQRCSISTALLT